MALGLFVTTMELPPLSPEMAAQGLGFDCDFSSSCRWASIGSTPERWRLARGEPDVLLWLAATGTISLPCRWLLAFFLRLLFWWSKIFRQIWRNAWKRNLCFEKIVRFRNYSFLLLLAEPFSLIEIRGGTPMDMLSSDVIDCQRESSLFSFTYWTIGIKIKRHF